MSKKVLIIEDNAEIRENTAELLELSNYSVQTAENGKIGVKIAKDWKPNIIICDIMMPELDGYGVLHMLNKDPQTASIPFIFLSAKADKSDIRKGMNLGADDYLTKPFEESELLDAIDIRLKKTDAIFNIKNEHTASKIDEFYQNIKNITDIANLSQVKSKSILKKQILYQEGDNVHYIYMLVSGQIKCSKNDNYGKEFITHIISPGDFFGYQDVLSNTPHSETALAVTDSEVLLIPREDFEKILYHNRDIAVGFIKIMANNIQEKEEQLLKLAFSPVRERTAYVLLKSLEKSNTKKVISYSREDLASMVGTATESLIRTLSEFKEEGLVEIKGREIQILDESKIKKLAGIL